MSSPTISPRTPNNTRRNAPRNFNRVPDTPEYQPGSPQLNGANNYQSSPGFGSLFGSPDLHRAPMTPGLYISPIPPNITGTPCRDSPEDRTISSEKEDSPEVQGVNMQEDVQDNYPLEEEEDAHEADNGMQYDSDPDPGEQQSHSRAGRREAQQRRDEILALYQKRATEIKIELRMLTRRIEYLVAELVDVQENRLDA